MSIHCLLRNRWRVGVLLAAATMMSSSCARPRNAAPPELVLQTGRSGGVNSIAFSSDGKTLASGTGDTVRLWRTQTGQLQRTLRPAAGAVSVAFSPDGKMVASGSYDGTVKLWKASSGRLLATLRTLPSDEKEKVSTDWIAFTSENYYTGSEGVKQFIRWRVGGKILPAEAYERTFHRPDWVQKALQGEELLPPEL